MALFLLHVLYKNNKTTTELDNTLTASLTTIVAGEVMSCSLVSLKVLFISNVNLSMFKRGGEGSLNEQCCKGKHIHKLIHYYYNRGQNTLTLR